VYLPAWFNSYEKSLPWENFVVMKVAVVGPLQMTRSQCFCDEMLAFQTNSYDRKMLAKANVETLT
jgi:hypothetical protein